MVSEVHCETSRIKPALRCQVVWLCPDLPWALDGLEYGFYCLQDVFHTIRSAPDHRQQPCGEEVVGHLSRHLTQFVRPMFVKRDNGGDLNYSAVNNLLEDNMIILTNSPCHTDSSNEAIEHSQDELKTQLRKSGNPTTFERELTLML
ncbi:MAG: hypothetical protein KQI81_12470 [Deltaproteobacteria bacterium]|nr:hypothetical protein [Deltaproteobacteria bacterium]